MLPLRLRDGLRRCEVWMVNETGTLRVWVNDALAHEEPFSERLGLGASVSFA